MIGAFQRLIRAAREMRSRLVPDVSSPFAEIEARQRDTFARGYVQGPDGLRSETDAEFRARILAGDTKTPGLSAP